MKKIFHLLFLLTSVHSFAQQQFDIFSYTEPAGWKKQLQNNQPVYIYTDEQKGSFAMIVLYPSAKSNGSPETDFSSAWQNEVVRPYSVTTIPKTEKSSPDGQWQILTGAAAFKQNNRDAVAMLTVFTAPGKTANILFLLNDMSLQTELMNFLGSVHCTKAGVSVPVINPPANRNNNAPNNNPVNTTAANTLTGEWSSSSMTSADFVNASGGYTGDATMASTTIFIFKTDGTYEERFNIYLNSKFHFFTYKGKFVRNGNSLTLYRGWYEHKVNAKMVQDNNPNNMKTVSYTYTLSQDPVKNKAALQLTCSGDNCVSPDKMYRVK